MVDVLFINSTKDKTINTEINGTLLLGTKLLQDGFDVQVLRFGEIEEYQKDYSIFIDRITAHILALEPKCVSFYCLWPYFHVNLRIASRLKSACPGIIIVMGGPQASATAPAILKAISYVDYVCTGEGEDTVVPFFRSVLRNDCRDLDQIPGLFYRKDGVVTETGIQVPLCDLETLPHWDDRLYLDENVLNDPNITKEDYFMNIDVGRGCPYNCSFCSTSYFWKRTYRLKTPDRIISEIRYLHDRFGIRSFNFAHDAFTINQKLVSNVCDRIIEEGLDITWHCAARIDCITEELILKMKQAGLTQIEFGIETGSERMQKVIHKNLNLKRANRIIDFALQNNVEVGLFFICGFPDETFEDLSDTLDLLFDLRDRGVHYIGMAFLRFNPNTEDTENCFDKLYFDPSIKSLGRGIYGYEEELDMIRAHKDLFPFFYHYETTVRRDCQHLPFLVSLYAKFPNAIKYLRRLYKGDNLHFYRTFVKSNPACFNSSVTEITKEVFLHPLTLLNNMVDYMDIPFGPQLKDLLRYDWDYQQLHTNPEDAVVQNVYHFDYADFQERRPIEEYSDHYSLIRLEKINGTIHKTAYRIK